MLLHLSDNKLVCLQVLKSQRCWILIPESSVLLETRRLRGPCVFMFISSACVVFHVCLSPFALYHVSHVGPNLCWLYKHKLYACGFEFVFILCGILSSPFFMLFLSLSFSLPPPLWFPAILVFSFLFSPQLGNPHGVTQQFVSTVTEYGARRWHVDSESSLYTCHTACLS